MIIMNIIERLSHRHQIMEYINYNHALTLIIKDQQMIRIIHTNIKRKYLKNIRITFNKINHSNIIIINKTKISINIQKII
jgi:hypothetical protein